MKDYVFSITQRCNKLKRMFHKIRAYLLPGSCISSEYVSLGGAEAKTESKRLINAWQDNSLPQRQRKLVDRQLHQFRSGARVQVFDVLVDSLRSLPYLKPESSLLEVGCSSGFYCEVLEIAGLPIRYSGCDYSEAFIRLAKERYPYKDFAVEDATALHYPDSSFDIVISGCCLLHIPSYSKAVKETARVARCYAIFHRTPVVWGQAEQWYRKQAYGVETVEIHFVESEFLCLLNQNGLEVITTFTLSQESTDASRIQGYANRTYVCKKKEVQ